MEKHRSKQTANEIKETLKSSKCKRLSKSNVMKIIESWGRQSEIELLPLANAIWSI